VRQGIEDAAGFVTGKYRVVQGSDVVLVATPAAPARPEPSSTPASVVESVSLCKPVEAPAESQITAARPILTPLLNQAKY
jgi:hypothetical protein